MNSANEQEEEVDIRGQICPSCLLIALKEVNSRRDVLAEQGAAVCILTDSRHSTSTIPESVRNMGYQASVEKADDYYRIKVWK